MKSIFVVAATLAALLVATGVQGSPTPGDVSSWDNDGHSNEMKEEHDEFKKCKIDCDEWCEKLFVGV
jgi:hypothetical protein